MVVNSFSSDIKDLLTIKMGFLRIVVCQLGETSKKIGASSLSIYTFLWPHQVQKKGKNDPLKSQQ